MSQRRRGRGASKQRQAGGTRQQARVEGAARQDQAGADETASDAGGSRRQEQGAGTRQAGQGAGSRGSGRNGRILNLVGAVLVTSILFVVSAFGAGPLPPLGSAFNPGTGVWSAAADARLPHTQTLRLAGLDQPAGVIFEANGTAHIQAGTDHDLFLVLGYLHAEFRLFQMDLLRRQGEGLLSQIVGPAALGSDEFELKLGLLRTAQQEWQSAGSRVRQAALAYADGVNDRILEDVSNHNLPLLFKMLGYHPTLWTPLDSLVIQGDMTQTLDFTDVPLDYSLLVKALGYARTMQWFPILPPNQQHPYDPGPYHQQTPAALLAQRNISTTEARAVAALARQLAALPPGALHQSANSNNWAVDGAKTASGKPLLAGDPHLHQTLPAIWYQVGADAPSYHFNGVSIPGTPIILIGHNQHISWSLTNVQNQATLFYLEKTDAHHANQYYWNGAWRRMATVSYDIPVKGGGSEHLTVQSTIHGPVLTDERLPGQQIAVDWMGAQSSQDLDVMLGIIQASNFTAFRDALRNWHAPSQNFIYADDRNNIGLISAGYYPIVKRGDPWLPLPGTGESDVVGTIPFDDIPQVYDPPSHFVFSANQRPVAGSYPYYIGTTLNFFADGYRANRIYSVLQNANHLRVQDMENLQTDTHDYLAMEIVPRLLGALSGAHLTAQEQQARALLQGWGGAMEASSPAASIWWTFWTQYLHDTFQPWWSADKVPSSKFTELAISPDLTSLNQDLEAWTLHDPANAAFSPAHGARRTAPTVMLASFQATVRTLAAKLGADPRTWQWGRLHTRQFDSLAQIPSLGYGPRPGNGDSWTVDAADGYPTSSAGPSWRFIMDWGSGAAEGVYPGGQSENPVSDWYQNEIAAWWDGRYYPILDAVAARAQRGSVTWTLHP